MNQLSHVKLQDFYLYKAIHVLLHIVDGHSLHDNVHDASLQGLPLLTSSFGETTGSACCSSAAQACRLTLQLLPTAVT